MITCCNFLVTLTNLICTAEYTTDLGLFHPLFEETNNGKQYICLNGFSVIVVWIGWEWFYIGSSTVVRNRKAKRHCTLHLARSMFTKSWMNNRHKCSRISYQWLSEIECKFCNCESRKSVYVFTWYCFLATLKLDLNGRSGSIRQVMMELSSWTFDQLQIKTLLSSVLLSSMLPTREKEMSQDAALFV